MASRTASNSLRALRPAGRPVRLTTRHTAVRRYATGVNTGNGSASASSSSGVGMGTALTGGVVGGSLVFLAAYGYYHFSGAKTMVNSLHQTKSYFDNATKKLQNATPEPNEAIEWLRSTALSYSAFIPGARGYVDSAFNDLDAVRSKHGDEVDKIVKETYDEIKKVSKDKGASIETAQKVWDILQNRMKEIGSLAGDAMEDIMNNHPGLKDKVGGNLDQLKNLQKQLGPEAEKIYNDTTKQVSEVISTISTKGFSTDTFTKVQQIVKENVDKLKKMSEQAYDKGMEQAKPYLEKNPQIKKLVEENSDALKSGDYTQLWQKVKDAASSGKTEDLEKFVKNTADQAKSKGSSMGSAMGIDVDKYMNMIPGGSEIMPKLQQLQEIGSKHGKEAEDLLKSTIDEIKSVLGKKVEEGQKIAEKAKKEGSS